MNALAAPEIQPCPLCGHDELVGSPHRHETPPSPGWDPMPARPAVVYCDAIDVNAYWTSPDWQPRCCLVHLVAFERRREMDRDLHPTRYRPPSLLAPIPLTRDPDGPSQAVLDSGGGWPFARPGHHYIGAIGRRDGHATLDRDGTRVAPWRSALGPRLEGFCRKHHVTNEGLWWEHRHRAICSLVARAVVERAHRPAIVAAILDVTEERVVELLDIGLGRVWGWVSADLNEIAIRSRR